MDLPGYVLAMCAAGVGAIVNATAGGGTLVSFPTLVALGVPPVGANATNMIAMCPGYFAGTYAQRVDLAGLRPALRVQAVCSVFGGVAGAALLLMTEELFREVVPFLILASALLLAVQVPLRRVLSRRELTAPRSGVAPGQLATLFVAACYGGYFGAGLGIVLLAVLGLFSPLPFNRLNAIKQLLSVAIGVSSALVLAFTRHADWALVAWMMPGAFLGGTFGGRVVSRVNPDVLRVVVVIAGCAIAAVYFVT
jgi:uncharacterized membrane protein YfcA